MIDLHSHILPGIDDGPGAVEGSLELARAAVEAGITEIVATPHVSWRYSNTANSIGGAVAEMRGHLAAHEIPLELHAGAEVAMTQVEDIEPAELRALHIGGGPWLLLEPPFTPVASGLLEIVSDLQSRGHRILLAHPERCPAIHRKPGLLAEMVSSGVLASVTAGSLVGHFGSTVRRMAVQILQDGLAHNVASDAHDASKRPPGMSAEIERAGLGALSEWLTVEVPAAILLGSDVIPERPEYGPVSRSLGSRIRSRVRQSGERS